MGSKRWTWKISEQPNILKLIEMQSSNSNWCDELEAAKGYTTGKVLSVCAALSILQEAIASNSEFEVTDEDTLALKLLESWIDEPSKEHFEKICDMLFGEDEEQAETPANLSDPVLYALRCSTSHPDGCGEIAWALESLCECMVELGFNDEWLQISGLKGVRARMEINT